MEDSASYRRVNDAARVHRAKHNRQELSLKYASRGWPVIPLHDVERGRCSCRKPKGKCKAGKHPRDSRGHGEKDATTDREQISAWWRKWPDANIGIVTGVRSSLVVLDVDSIEARGVLNEAMRTLGVSLPDTVTVKTGRGWHHYFALPSGLLAPKQSLQAFNQISFQTDDSYVVGAGSLHELGWVYEFEHDLDDKALALVPDWMLDSEWARLVCRIGQRLRPSDTELDVFVEGVGPFRPAGRSASLGSAPPRSDNAGAGNCSAPPRLAAENPPIPTSVDQVDRVDQVDEVDHVCFEWDGETPESLVKCLKLTGPTQTQHGLYSLVRGLKLDLQLTPDETIRWVKRWHAENVAWIQHESDWLVLELTARRAIESARIPLRAQSVPLALERAKALPLPAEAEQFADNPRIQLAVALCAQLQAVAPGKPFLLSCRQLARALQYKQPISAYSILKLLQDAGLLKCVKQGTRGKGGLAAFWLYMPAINATQTTDSQSRTNNQ